MSDMRCPECMAWLTVEPVSGEFSSREFQKYVRAMPQSEAQTALIFLSNFLADCASRRIRPEAIPSDMTPQAEALIERLGEGE